MPVLLESALELAVGIVTLGGAGVALLRTAGGWRPLLNGRVGPWLGGAIVSLGLALWQAVRIDQAKSGALDPATLSSSRLWLAVGAAGFTILLGVAVLRLPSPRHEAQPRDIGT